MKDNNFESEYCTCPPDKFIDFVRSCGNCGKRINFDEEDVMAALELKENKMKQNDQNIGTLPFDEMKKNAQGILNEIGDNLTADNQRIGDLACHVLALLKHIESKDDEQHRPVTGL